MNSMNVPNILYIEWMDGIDRWMSVTENGNGETCLEYIGYILSKTIILTSYPARRRAKINSYIVWSQEKVAWWIFFCMLKKTTTKNSLAIFLLCSFLHCRRHHRHPSLSSSTPLRLCERLTLSLFFFSYLWHYVCLCIFFFQQARKQLFLC